MKRLKTLVVLAGLAAILFITGRMVITEPSPGKNPEADAAGIEKRYKIQHPINQKDSETQAFTRETISAYFSDTVLKPRTHEFFHHLDHLELTQDPDQDHLGAIHHYLLEQLAEEQAEKMFELYKRYLDYQISLQDHLRNVGTPQSPEEALAQLDDLQDYRRDVFGPREADMLFGPDMKARKFHIKREAILFDPDLYGAEKEEKLKEMALEMDEDIPAVAEDRPAYDQYQDALQLYEKDLAELSTDDERRAFMENLKINLLDPSQLLALEDAETGIKAEHERRETYYAREKEILDDPGLNNEQRAQQIRALQDRTFGDDVDAFRRGEIMRKELDMRAQAAREKRDREEQVAR